MQIIIKKKKETLKRLEITFGTLAHFFQIFLSLPYSIPRHFIPFAQMWKKNEFGQLSRYYLEAFIEDITRAGRRTRVRRRRRVIGSLETRVSRPSDPAMNRWRREGLSFNRSTLPFPPLHHPPGRHGTRIRRECILTPRSYFHWDPGTFPIEVEYTRYDGLPVYTIPRHLSFRCRTKLDDRQGVAVGWLRDGWCTFLFSFFLNK